ncbi:hypothetical protein FRC17_007157 [Serendipita sp. 399]|nr:hypothetical protein FRC17_007157 [Serendipita sp. 399]
MPVAKLRMYLDAYGIKPRSVLEKDDLIEAIIDARSLNGGLSSENERFYRRQTVARRPPMDTRHRGMFSGGSSRPSGPAPPPRPRSTDPRVQSNVRTSRPTSPPPMPNLGPNRTSDPYLQHNQYMRPTSPRQERPTPAWSSPASPPPPPPRNPPNQYAGSQFPQPAPRPTSPPPQPRWQTRPTSPPPAERMQDTLQPPNSGRSRSRSVPSADGQSSPSQYRYPEPPPPPSSPRPRGPTQVPLLATILGLSREDVNEYSVSTLKGILQANHVNARLILEKSELVDKVMGLIETERRERAREQAIHEAEERARQEYQRQRMVQVQTEAGINATTGQGQPQRTRSPPPAPPMNPVPSPISTGFIERDGLCVICQDEEANIAIVDCGHMNFSDTSETGDCPFDTTDNANAPRTGRTMLVDEDAYPYPTSEGTESTYSSRSSKSRRPRSLTHPSTIIRTVENDHRAALRASSSIGMTLFRCISMEIYKYTDSRTTFFATMYLGPTVIPPSIGVDHSALSSVLSRDQVATMGSENEPAKPHASNALQWAAGSACFLISLGICLWLFQRCRKSNHSPRVPHEYAIASSESSSTLSTSHSWRSLGDDADAQLSGHSFSGIGNDSSIIAQDPLASSTVPQEPHAHQAFEPKIEKDRFAHLHTAPFPGKSDLCKFVFPSVAAGVQREVLMEREAKDIHNSTFEAPLPRSRVLAPTRPLNPQSRRLPPKPFGLKTQPIQRKQFSPLGDVLYSTSGADVLETVQEEVPQDFLSESPIIINSEARSFDETGAGSIVVVASSTAYAVAPTGLRARRKSSPLLPFPDVEIVQPFEDIPSPIAAPNVIRRGRHRRSVATVDLSSMLPNNSSQSMSEEDKKFAEFVKQLTRRAKYGRRDRRISSLRVEEGTDTQIFIPSISEEYKGHHFGKDTNQFNADYLAPPTSAANLSDFSSSSSSLSSDIVSSSSSSSVIGIAL